MSQRLRVEDVCALPAHLVEVAPAQWQDANGHVNVRHFYDLHLRGAIASLQALGLDEEYRRSRGWSVFSVEQHIRFLGEIHVGDELSTHMRWLGRADKVVHAISLILNRTTAQVVSTLEVLEAHVDLSTRRTCAWAPELAERIDDLVGAHAGLTWSVPTSGAIRLKR
ncbi:thioesterase family protein [Gephyromycinifex aptenodytis]|uniref:thioesterase family protein n=1 Tax=Gephyromycinifex aptenodytis TaxID=2716227 RepID=UPI001448A130|nr:thioesterase family protein [Gephyromycinifex aptenodytis]